MRILIPDAESGHALGVIQSLLRCEGVEIVCLSTQERNAARYVRKMTGCEIVGGDSTDEEKVEAVLVAADRYSADMILPVAERATGILAKYSDRFRGIRLTIPVPPYESFRIATDKLRLAQFCAQRGIPHPLTYSVPEFLETIETSARSIELPVIIKPVGGEGGKGIELISREAEFAGMDFEGRQRSYGDVVVQEFIEGYDIDLSLLALNGDILAYTIQKGILGRKSRFAASGGIQFVHLPQLLEVASIVTRALNYSGVAHLDFRCDRRDGLFKLVDMNCRFWGSLLGSLKSGVNFPWLACQLSLGKKVQFKGFDESRYFDLLSVARNPVAALRLKVRLGETNLEYWVRAPFANAANTIFRRLSGPPPRSNQG